MLWRIRTINNWENSLHRDVTLKRHFRPCLKQLQTLELLTYDLMTLIELLCTSVHIFLLWTKTPLHTPQSMMRQTRLGNAISLVCTYRPINDFDSCYEGLEYRRFF